jgi:hypothetical protein
MVHILNLHLLDVLASLKILQGSGLGVGSGLANLKSIQLSLINNGLDLIVNIVLEYYILAQSPVVTVV